MGRGSEQTFFQRRQTDGQQAYEKMLNITNHQGNANQTHNDTTSYLPEQLSSERQQITSVGEDVEKREPPGTVGGNVSWYSHYRKQYRVSSKN